LLVRWVAAGSLRRPDAGRSAEEPDERTRYGMDELIGQTVACGVSDQEMMADLSGEGVHLRDCGRERDVMAEQWRLPRLGQCLSEFEERGVLIKSEFLSKARGLECPLQFERPELGERMEDVTVLCFRVHEVAGQNVASQRPERVRERLNMLALITEQLAQSDA
jgi:hypothetical protein